MSPIGTYRVAGDSMQPALLPGDTIVGLKWFRAKVGVVVVVRRPERLIIKRITRIDASGIWIEGDNSGRSTDSRHFGVISRKDLVARQLLRLRG